MSMSDSFRVSKTKDQVIKNGLFDDFRRLSDCSQDAIYHYDIGSRQFLFHNQIFRYFFQLKERSEISIPANLILQSIHTEDRQSVKAALTESLNSDHAEGEAEYRILHPDGTILWLHDRWIVLRNKDGKPHAIQGFIRDNTRQQLSEIQFIESKENALIGSYIVQEGRFKYVNPQFISITGFDEAELIDMDSLSLVHEDYREHVRKSAMAMLKGISLVPYEFCVTDKTGSTHWVMETVTSFAYKGKRATLGYFMDVTELHQMKDNLSTLGLMVGTISHSLRGCLSGLDASLYLIERGFYRNRPAQIEEGLDVTKLMADRIRKLVLDILYYSKERDLEIEDLEVWQFAKEITIFIEKRIKAANIRFVTDFQNTSGNFAIDPEVIRAALINILENAMEACIEDVREIDHRIRFAVRADKASVTFDISDNGPGMEKEQANSIFQLFSSSKGKRGTGIGLFVTRKGILKHGGTISVDSSPDAGARFRIVLPRKPVVHREE
jgi:PAS domain S-box-containing protein